MMPVGESADEGEGHGNEKQGGKGSENQPANHSAAERCILLAAVAGIWWALERSFRDAEIVEDLTLSADQITLIRHGPRGKRADWQANPHWVKLTLHPKSGPVPDYLTLSGNGREVELGAFLTPEERRALAADLRERLRPKLL